MTTCQHVHVRDMSASCRQQQQQQRNRFLKQHLKRLINRTLAMVLSVLFEPERQWTKTQYPRHDTRNDIAGQRTPVPVVAQGRLHDQASLRGLVRERAARAGVRVR